MFIILNVDNRSFHNVKTQDDESAGYKVRKLLTAAASSIRRAAKSCQVLPFLHSPSSSLLQPLTLVPLPGCPLTPHPLLCHPSLPAKPHVLRSTTHSILTRISGSLLQNLMTLDPLPLKFPIPGSSVIPSATPHFLSPWTTISFFRSHENPYFCFSSAKPHDLRHFTS